MKKLLCGLVLSLGTIFGGINELSNNEIERQLNDLVIKAGLFKNDGAELRRVSARIRDLLSVYATKGKAGYAKKVDRIAKLGIIGEPQARRFKIKAEAFRDARLENELKSMLSNCTEISCLKEIKSKLDETIDSTKEAEEEARLSLGETSKLSLIYNNKLSILNALNLAVGSVGLFPDTFKSFVNWSAITMNILAAVSDLIATNYATDSDGKPQDLSKYIVVLSGLLTAGATAVTGEGLPLAITAGIKAAQFAINKPTNQTAQLAAALGSGLLVAGTASALKVPVTEYVINSLNVAKELALQNISSLRS